MFQRCPKCGHSPLPDDQALPAACPACGVILDKVRQSLNARIGAEEDVVARAKHPAQCEETDATKRLTASELLFTTDTRFDPVTFWARVILLVGFAVWGWVLIAQDYRIGEIGSSFIHRPLLVFHEAGHVVFRILGEWMMVLGGSLGQLIMPAILCGALLIKNRDPFGASIGLWFLGVSLMDLAPYIYDALHPQLVLLSGMTGDEGGHDWIFLLTTLGWLPKAQFLGALSHKLGALVVLLSLAWGAWLLRLQYLIVQQTDL